MAGVRRWVTRAIEDGGTPRWFVGLLLKHGIELGTAAVFAFVVTRLAMTQIPARAVSVPFGHTVGTWPAVWVGTTVVAWRLTYCSFTRRPGDDEPS